MVMLGPGQNKRRDLDGQEAIFRSAPMTLVQFYVTIELARDVVYHLGKIGKVHFRDLNSKLTPFQRTFMDDLRHIDEIESRLSFLSSMMLKYEVSSAEIYDRFVPEQLHLPLTSELDATKVKIGNFYDRIKQLDDSYNTLRGQKDRLVENRHVVNALNEFYDSILGRTVENSNSNFSINDDSDDDIALLHDRNSNLEEAIDRNSMEFGYSNALAGTIARDKVPSLRKILWRTTHRNHYFHDIPILDQKFINHSSSKGEMIEKNIFIVFVHGDFLKLKIKKIILSLDGTLFDNVTGDSSARMDTLAFLNNKIEDLEHVVDNTKNHLITELMILQDAYLDWLYVIQRERLVYEALNKFDFDSTRRCLVGEGWIPKEELGHIRQTLKTLVRDKSRLPSGQSIGSQETIPLNSNSAEISTGDHESDALFSVGDETFDESYHNIREDEYDPLIAVVNELSTNRTPPTYHKTNKFTAAYQLIIDAYGIATYQEVNPGLATVITFPFMFAIMFGDLGHGFIVFLIGLYLVLNEVYFNAMRNKDEIFEMAFSGRYIILLMGIFSMYTGLMYNDIFSKSMTLFKSGWEWNFPKDYDYEKDGPIALEAKQVAGHTYVFGLDWAWHGAENNLLFTNSYKMKLSVLMGFAHMNYSLFFSLVNYRFFESRVDIIGNFIPGFLFMESIFGYLALTIIYKWSVDWIGKSKQPPGLLNMLINMFLSPGKIEEQLYPGQAFVQVVLVMIAAVCVPWLLLYKPMTLKRQNNKAVEQGFSDLNSQLNHDIQLQEEEEAVFLENELNDDPDDDLTDLSDQFNFPNDIEPLHHNSTSHGDGHDTFNFGDIVIHQVIHTIEFCLNCVSHTASYLRLWALSLAHAQLSSVLWSMTLQNAFGVYGAKGIVMTVVLFGMWFTLTVCILVLMEGTSAMLHSLRLHWVEAMSKFFEGEGYAFEPFSFDLIDI